MKETILDALTSHLSPQALIVQVLKLLIELMEYQEEEIYPKPKNGVIHI